jgi:hypothetical protein
MDVIQQGHRKSASSGQDGVAVAERDGPRECKCKGKRKVTHVTHVGSLTAKQGVPLQPAIATSAHAFVHHGSPDPPFCQNICSNPPTGTKVQSVFFFSSLGLPHPLFRFPHLSLAYLKAKHLEEHHHLRGNPTWWRTHECACRAHA